MPQEFYKKHFNAVQMANSFTTLLGSKHKELGDAFRESLAMGIKDGGEVIGNAFNEVGLDEKEVSWMDSQMTVILKLLVPVVRDPDLPDEYSICVWAIEGAFE